MNAARWELRIDDPAYPEQLRESPNPPDPLYGIGDPARLKRGLAVIGARNATPYGLTCARRFAYWAALHDVCVISGAAMGCDITAHEAAVDAGGTTVAVLGCGADLDYPRRSSRTLAAMRANHVVVSEVPWGSPPQRWAFAARNRIIAGLAAAVLVVEAGLPSGTFGTADHALAAGRDVLAVPGSILAPECRGSNRLICQGATPVTNESELRDALFSAGILTMRDLTAPRDTLVDACRDELVRALTANPMRPDDIAFHMRSDVVSVARRLTELELAGVVQRLRDGRYSLTLRCR